MRVMLKGREELEEMSNEEIEKEIKEQEGILDKYDIPESLRTLTEGYLAYAKEIIMSRAIPMIDGFKPSQRRILYVMEEIEKVRGLSKSANIAGATTKIHPHSDTSNYDTMVRMTDLSEYLNIPFLEGKGSFGKVYYGSEISAAAPRYTQVGLNKITKELFKGMSGVERIPSYNNEYLEPVTLPVSFPSILCNPTEGIAVGIATKIPAFNFHEVIAATINYIKTGQYPEELYPDFTTGGYVVKNDREMEKMLKSGKGKLVLRGKHKVEKNLIVITEIPYYTTVKRIMEDAEKIEGVVDVRNETDRKRGLRVVIECRTQRQVPEIVEEMIRTTQYEMNLHTNIVIISQDEEGKNVIEPEIGINGVIREWVEYRKVVMTREYEERLEKVRYEIKFLNILVDLMTTEKREPFLKSVLYEGKEKSEDLLRGYYEGITDEYIERIMSRSIGSLSNVGNKQRELIRKYEDEEKELVEGISDISREVIKELERVNEEYKYPRKTKITKKEYNFENYEKKEPEAEKIGVVLEGKFLKKLRGNPYNLSQPDVRECMSDDVLTMIDTRGRLIRVKLDEIEYSNYKDKGTYIPLYLEEEDTNYEIKDYEVSREYKEGYLYEDGYIAVIDYNEWKKKQRVVKVIEQGIAPDYIEQMIGKVHIDKEYILVRTSKGKLGYFPIEFVERSRRGRSKLIPLYKEDSIVDYVCVDQEELEEIIEDLERFKGRYRVIRPEDVFKEARYIEEREKLEWGSKREDK